MKFNFKIFIMEFLNFMGAACFSLVCLWFIVSFVSWNFTIFGYPLLFAMVRLIILGSIIFGLIKGARA